jgi:hypothetical protein
VGAGWATTATAAGDQPSGWFIGHDWGVSKVQPGRYAATVDGDVVLFIIGMRINSFWRVWKWLPVFAAMPRMIAELSRNRDLGLIGRPRTMVSGRVITVLQYWRTFEHLETYARAADRQHLPAWRRFNRRIRNNGTVGIFHETYRVTPGSVETVYGNMPPFGLGDAVGTAPVGPQRQTAAERLGLRADDVPPVDPY